MSFPARDDPQQRDSDNEPDDHDAEDDEPGPGLTGGSGLVLREDGGRRRDCEDARHVSSLRSEAGLAAR
jgi:hypothetical protein